MNYWLLLIPVLSAFIGWVTIRIAIWLLFHPLQPKKLAGITLHGAWPSSREKIAAEIGRYAASMISPEKITQQISFDEIRPLIEQHMDHFLRHKLQEQMPMIATFIGDKTIQQLKVIFIQEIELLFPEIINKMMIAGSGPGNMESIISQKISTIPAFTIEKMFNEKMAPAVKKAALLGGLIGFFTGLIQLLIALLT
ncbi:hypothetical protein LZZ85_20250 [Terrimonas sp. NA20]|uniref:DUF445 domain-containing protein n=1 Tax=Terrimonas ginsenosidimutans TaxID=2908004 RepID=A0ABS9KW99_9BACT|nr:hypothetical protein [Terrimonas ginsenosidimutans]MCG2616642.1 hypothetical protein [Terrimonas ginsenosidimutans]